MDAQRVMAQWCAVARGKQIGDPDIYFRFIAAWVAFNALYASRYSGNRDRGKVLRFARSEDAKQHHGTLLHKNPEYLMAVKHLMERPVRNLLHPGQSYGVNDQNNLTEVLNCVYQVRSNLFHGGKQFDDARDEGLVSASYNIIVELISQYIPNCD